MPIGSNLDPAILLRAQGLRLPDLGAIEQRAISLRALADQEMLRRMQMQEAHEAQQRQRALEAALPIAAEGRFEPEALQRAVGAHPIAAQGLYKYADERMKARADVEEKAAKTRKEDIEGKVKALDSIANVAAEASKMPDPVSVSRVLSMAKFYGVELPAPPQDPAQFGPYLQSLAAAAYAQKDRVAQAEAERANRAREGQQAATLAETTRAHKASEGLTASGQRQAMTIAQMGDARARELAQLQREQALAQRADKPLTEVQGNATAFAMRMRDARKTLDELEASGEVNPASVGVAIAGQQGIVGTPVNWAIGKLSPKVQVYEQAKRNWISANLRKESGAAIPPAELEQETRKWFPVPGDSQEVIDSKRAARETAEQAVMVQAGPGAKNVSPAEPFEQVRQRAAKQKEGAPAKPKLGEVREGYRYVGGDPAQRSSWERTSE